MRPIHQQPDLVEQVYQSLVDAICDGALQTGQRLNQEELADTLQVSRQPIVQAIQILKRQGFVISTGRRGVEVAPFDPVKALHYYNVREALDAMAARQAAKRELSDEQKQRGQQILDEGIAAVKANDMGASIHQDMLFHRFVYELCGNPVIDEILHAQWQYFRRLMGLVMEMGSLNQYIWEEHQTIFDAIINKDAKTAEAVAAKHAEIARTRLIAYLESSDINASPETTSG